MSVVSCSSIHKSWCTLGEQVVIWNKNLIFAILSIKKGPLKLESDLIPLNYLHGVKVQTSEEQQEVGHNSELNKFPRAQPVSTHTAGKLYCFWCRSLKGKHFSRKIYFLTILFLFLCLNLKREQLLCYLWYLQGSNIYMIFSKNLLTCVYAILLCVKPEYLFSDNFLQFYSLCLLFYA